MSLRSLVLMAAIGATTAFGLIGNDVQPFLRAAYPTNPLKRDALATCQAADAVFVRFSSADRAQCYALLRVAR